VGDGTDPPTGNRDGPQKQRTRTCAQKKIMDPATKDEFIRDMCKTIRALSRKDGPQLQGIKVVKSKPDDAHRVEHHDHFRMDFRYRSYHFERWLFPSSAELAYERAAPAPLRHGRRS